MKSHILVLVVAMSQHAIAAESPVPPPPTVSAERVEFISELDGWRDWYLVVPGKPDRSCCINLHGHGSAGDQLWVRTDIRPNLDATVRKGMTILSPNLRGNAWMSPAAAADLAQIIEAAYRPADKTPHSASANAARLTMPIVLVHGERDETIPVEEARDLAAKMKTKQTFVYREIPDGGHDAPLAHWAEAVEALEGMVP